MAAIAITLIVSGIISLAWAEIFIRHNNRDRDQDQDETEWP